MEVERLKKENELLVSKINENKIKNEKHKMTSGKIKIMMIIFLLPPYALYLIYKSKELSKSEKFIQIFIAIIYMYALIIK